MSKPALFAALLFAAFQVAAQPKFRVDPPEPARNGPPSPAAQLQQKDSSAFVERQNKQPQSIGFESHPDDRHSRKRNRHRQEQTQTPARDAGNEPTYLKKQ